MEYLIYYIIFALATALTGLLEIHGPVWTQIKTAKADISNSRITLAVIFFISGLIAAPVLFFACVVPTLGESFRDKYKNSLLGEG